MSASEVSKLVFGEFGVEISKRTIQREVAEDRIGVSPKKKGPQGIIPPLIFDNLCNAFESYIQIKQLNGQGTDITNNKLIELLKKCTRSVTALNFNHLLSCLLKSTALELTSGRSNNVEERRVCWTTYFNIKSWFDNWERDLLELGFADVDVNGKTVIPREQLAKIVNIDETCLVLDGSKCNRGGRPEITCYSPNLPNLGKATIKTSMSTTMITGSTAAGEPMPPHFQFSTTAQSEDTQRVNIRMRTFFPKIRGKFGTDCEKEWPVTIAMNSKGGMDEREFRSYFLNSIVPLFPDAEDVTGKRVIIKVDSGPGRMELGFLAEARTLGFIIYPGVLNTTAVTQETDQSYGPFKTQFKKKLKILSDSRLIGNYSTCLPPWMVGIVCSAFDIGFSKEQNCAVWKKCGAAPLTRACLQNNSQVRREIGDDDDAANTAMTHIQESNNISTHFLSRNGFDGNVFKDNIKKVSRKSVTVRHSTERIEKNQQATTHGNLIHATGGGHLTDDDIFLAAQKKVVETQIKELHRRKESAGKMLDVERKAREILVQTNIISNLQYC
eukprot:CCRYP_015507-RC/>CCRYP_015507-RC protein AED:0.06 eAED:0.04 QI:0/0/0/1/0/0/2/0/553